MTTLAQRVAELERQNGALKEEVAEERRQKHHFIDLLDQAKGAVASYELDRFKAVEAQKAAERECERLRHTVAVQDETIARQERERQCLVAQRGQYYQLAYAEPPDEHGFPGETWQERSERLRADLETFRRWAAKCHAHWDADEDAKAGKILMALAGMLRGYSKDIDDALTRLEQDRKEASSDNAG